MPLLIAAENDLEADSRTNAYVQDPDALPAYDYSEMNNKLEKFLDALTS